MSVTHDGQRWSNAAVDRVAIEAYDPEWPRRFAKEAAALRAVLDRSLGLRAGRDYRVHHVGSTAVPGLAAKPVIDIVIAVENRTVWPELVDPVQTLGYVYWADNPASDRLFFVKGMPPYGTRRTHHVHVRPPEQVQRLLQFRDYLRAHPVEARRYERLKRHLARAHPIDRDAYTEAKTAMIEQMLRRAGFRAG